MTCPHCTNDDPRLLELVGHFWHCLVCARKWRAAVVALLALLIAAPVFAQTDVVAHVKADLVARGVSLSGTCGAFEVTKRVAWTLRASGWGLIAKPSGENCQGYAGDKLVSSTGRFVDLLIDQGGANTPAWQERAASADELAARVDPMDPGDTPAPAPGPPPIVAPPPSVPPPVVPAPIVVDYTATLQQILAAEQLLLQTQQQLLSVEKDTNTHVTTMDKTIGQTLGSIGTFVGKYIAPAVAAWIAAKKL